MFVRCYCMLPSVYPYSEGFLYFSIQVGLWTSDAVAKSSNAAEGHASQRCERRGLGSLTTCVDSYISWPWVLAGSEEHAIQRDSRSQLDFGHVNKYALRVSTCTVVMGTMRLRRGRCTSALYIVLPPCLGEERLEDVHLEAERRVSPVHQDDE